LNKDRIDALCEKLKAQGLQAAAILPSPGLFYLTGMSTGLSERPWLFVFTAEGESLAVCPAFEAERVRRSSGVTNLCTYTDEQGATAGFRTLREKVGELKGVAMEYQAARLLEYTLLKEACNVEHLQDLRPILAELRMKKAPAEVNKLQQAAALADAIMGELERNMRPGITEKELVALAHSFLKEKGQGTMSFITVVAGERSALPHASVSDRPLAPGDSVIVDLGCYVESYTSDITRSFYIGEQDEEMARIGAVVLEANRRAREAVKPGVTPSYLDHVAREYITSQGYGEYFTHRLGHGLGLEVHEEPYIVAGNDSPLEVGHTFTIEPGIYLPGKGGVRIEDDVCVTSTGGISLTTYPREVRVIK
jgi:Xaa-Pro dipeptidase